MSQAVKLGLPFALVALAVLGCRKSPRVESIEPAASASAQLPAAPPPPTAPVLYIGPAPAADPEAQRAAVLALLAGEIAADSLPEIATEPGEPLDHRLRDHLAPVTSGLGSIRGNAAVGSVVTSAPVSNGSQVVAGMRAGFRACYNRTLLDVPEAAGVVNMVLRVDAQGTVTDAKAKSAASLHQGMLQCLEARANAAQFAPPEGKSATLKFNVTFTLQ